MSVSRRSQSRGRQQADNQSRTSYSSHIFNNDSINTGTYADQNAAKLMNLKRNTVCVRNP